MSNTVEPPLLVVIVAGPTALLPKNVRVPELAMSIGALPLLMMPPWLVAPIFENFRDWPPAMPKLYAGAVELKFQRLTTVLAAENVTLFLPVTSKTAVPVGPGTVLGFQLVDKL